jgi:hypothetical protein
VFYVYGMRDDRIVEQAGENRIAYSVWWNALEGVEEIDRIPKVKYRYVFETISKMDAVLMRPESSDITDTDVLAEQYERYPVLRDAVETMMVSVDHNAHVRIEPNEPRLYDPRTWETVDIVD